MATPEQLIHAHLIHEGRSVQGAVDATNSVEHGQKDEKRNGKAESLVANENFFSYHKNSSAKITWGKAMLNRDEIKTVIEAVNQPKQRKRLPWAE